MTGKFTLIMWVCVVCVGLASASALADGVTVDAGYDLFQTQSGTSFLGAPLVGVPLGTYDFGGSIGVQNVGDADTVVQRLSDVTAVPGGSGTTSLIMDTLDLETVAPTTFGGMFPLNNYYFTLDPSSATTGSMTINFNNPGPGGTFTSFFDVFVDIHVDGLNGPVVATPPALTLTNTGDTWNNTPSDSPILIPGVNYMLNGTDTSNDFWPSPLQETEPGVTHSVADATPVPLPLSLWSELALFAGIAGYKFCRRYATA